MKKLIFWMLAWVLFITGCSIFTSDEKVTIKTESKEKKKDSLFTHTSVSKDLSGIIQEGPGRYPEVDQKGEVLPKEAIEDLKTLPANMKAETAYNQLIFLFRKDYRELEFRFANFNPLIPVSKSRRNAKPKKETLKVNIVVVVDSGEEMAKNVPGTNQKKMDRLKLQLKNSLRELQKDIPKGLSYHVMLKSYGGIVDKYTSLVPIDQIEKDLFPHMDEILPGSVTYLSDDLKFVMDQLKHETGGNVLNQIFLITGSKDNFNYSAISRAKEILESEIQGQVHAIDYGVTDQETKNNLQAVADGGLGEYIIANPTSNIPFDFKDQTDLQDDGYNPREYRLFKEEAWTKRMAELKENQIEEIDTLYGKEYDQLMAAVNYLKMNDVEKGKLFEEIEFRKKLLSNHYQKKLNRLKLGFIYSKKSLGLTD